MADKKISQLTAATTPLAGTEVVPIVQSGSTVKVPVSNLTAGRDVSVAKLTATDNVVISTAGKGVDFSANTHAAGMASELLDWYEYGTFTPTVTFSGGNGDLSYFAQQGWYVRIGKVVTFGIRVVFTETTASGNITGIGTLPFASASGLFAGGGAYLDNMTSISGGGTWFISAGATAVEVYQQASGASTSITNANTSTNSAIVINGSYIAA